MGFLYFSLMKFEIREGIKTDLPAVLKLIQELAEYEKALDQVTISLEDLENDGFGERPWYWFLVAEKNHKVIGISFYFIRYSTWKGKFLYLEDFVVKKENIFSAPVTIVSRRVIDDVKRFFLCTICLSFVFTNNTKHKKTS